MLELLKPMKISKLALHEYRMNTIGNKDLPKSEIAKKLTRNVMLGYPIPTKDKTFQWYAYGHMRILVKDSKKGNKIITIINRQPTIVGHEIDQQKKNKLNKVLKIS